MPAQSGLSEGGNLTKPARRVRSDNFQPPHLLTAKSFAEHHIEIIQCAGAVACEAGAVHGGERFRFQARELLEVLPVSGV
jgi:hypothetical protein